jgi:hypothetical protein
MTETVRTITITHETNQFDVTATLNRQTWLWDAIVTRPAGNPMPQPSADADRSAQNPNQCLAQATRWLLDASDHGELTHE